MGFFDLRFAELLLDSGADVEAQTLAGDRPLHTAVKYCHKSLVQLLLIHGANTETKTDKGLTPLEIAVKGMIPGIVKILILYGANITPHNIFEAIVLRATDDESLIIDIFTIANMFDLLFSSTERPGCECDLALPTLFNKLDSDTKDLLSNRILYKVFRNKELSTCAFKGAIEGLITRVDFVAKTLDIDLCVLESALHKLDRYIVVSSLKNEVAGPSLFKLAVNTLKTHNLWDQEIVEKVHPDIADKTDAMEVIESFLNKMRVKLKSESSKVEEKGVGYPSTDDPVSNDYELPYAGAHHDFVVNDHLPVL